MRITSSPDIDKWRATATLSPLEALVALWQEGFMVEQEALDAAENGIMPPAMVYAISNLPQQAQVMARIVWAEKIEVHRLHPTIAHMADAFDLPPEEVDRIFKTYKGWDQLNA